MNASVVQSWRVQRLHIPSGRESSLVLEDMTRPSVLELINRWNATGPYWKYYIAADGEPGITTLEPSANDSRPMTSVTLSAFPLVEPRNGAQRKPIPSVERSRQHTRAELTQR